MDWKCAPANKIERNSGLNFDNLMRGKKPKTFPDATAISFESIAQLTIAIDPENKDWARKVTKW